MRFSSQARCRAARLTAVTSPFAIQQLSMRDIEDVAARALAHEAPFADVVADFVAAVDWSGHGAATASVCDALGALEELSTNYAEGDISAADYKRTLRTFLATSARR
jgi:hypothetical protein